MYLSSSVWLISHKPNIYRSISAGLVLHKINGHTSIQEPQLGFLAVSHCLLLVRLIFTVFIIWILNCSSHTVQIRIVLVYQHLSPNRRMAQCTWAPPAFRRTPESQTQLNHLYLDGLFRLHLFLWYTAFALYVIKIVVILLPWKDSSIGSLPNSSIKEENK